ncbi:ABC transporter ATP-binding protein [soil metagenome]
MNCIETKNLNHTFSGGETVLKNINLQVPQGSLYGFLGPNGAGKTTTLRLLLGLIKKQKGEILIFNQPFSTHRIELLKQTGSLIESPSLYGHLTAAENLRVLQKVYQCPEQRINEVLEIVGLSHTKNKKTSNFSLGMKQRLSIAIALLHSPSLLILDEPTNGLDPNGILEIRDLLKKLNTEQNMTIIISSHLLTEIEKMVTHVGIINKGSIMFQGTLDELHLKQTQTAVIKFETNDPEQTARIISANGFTPALLHGGVSIPVMEEKKVAGLNKQLVQNNIEVYQIHHVKNDLESIFMDLVKNDAQ